MFFYQGCSNQHIYKISGCYVFRFDFFTHFCPCVAKIRHVHNDLKGICSVKLIDLIIWVQKKIISRAQLQLHNLEGRYFFVVHQVTFLASNGCKWNRADETVKHRRTSLIRVGNCLYNQSLMLCCSSFLLVCAKSHIFSIKRNSGCHKLLEIPIPECFLETDCKYCNFW